MAIESINAHDAVLGRSRERLKGALWGALAVALGVAAQRLLPADVAALVLVPAGIALLVAILRLIGESRKVGMTWPVEWGVYEAIHRMQVGEDPRFPVQRYLASLLDDELAIDALRRASVDVQVLRAALLAEHARPIEGSTPSYRSVSAAAIPMSNAVLSRDSAKALPFLKLAGRWASPSELVEAIGVLIAASETSNPCRDVLRRFGVSRKALAPHLRRLVVPGMRWQPAWASGSDRRDIVFHNDDKTHWSFVCALAHDLFGYSVAESATFASGVHREGTGIVRAAPASIADALVAEALRRAALAGSPLRVTAETPAQAASESSATKDDAT